MRASRGATSIAVAAAALAVIVAVAVLVLLGPLGPASAGVAQRPCSSYPTLGAPAPAGTKVPADLAARYALLRGPQRAADRLGPAQVTASLSASGLIMSGTGVIMSGTRFLGDAAFGGRIYLVPAEHLLAYRLAPLRCLAPDQRSLEQALLPQLRSEYRRPRCASRCSTRTVTAPAALPRPAALTPCCSLTAPRGSGWCRTVSAPSP